MDDDLKQGCDVVYDFYETYWVKQTINTAFDPASKKFKELPFEIASLMLIGVHYGAIIGCGYFSSLKPKKLKKEFTYYLTEKLKMPPEKAQVVADTIEKRKDSAGVKEAILMGRKAYSEWTKHKVEESRKKYNDLFAKDNK